MSPKEVFTRVYKTNEWGGNIGEFCSGGGSTEVHAAQYASVVRRFIVEKQIKTVVDLGCGDFTVGSRIVMDGLRYVGLDVVDELIKRNQEMYGSANVSFQVSDIVADDLPDAELCLIRQVFQHLSNSEILSILNKTSKYHYVIVTEHYPAPRVSVFPNRDKPHGGDTRLYDDSAVYLDQPPFHTHVSRVMLESDAESYSVYPGETIRTFLIEN